MNKKVLAILLVLLLIGAGAWGVTTLIGKKDNSVNAIPGAEQPLSQIISPAEMETEELFSAEPYAPDALEKVVIGTDDRITVYDPACYPFSAIANLFVHAQCGCEWQCTGYMISPRGMVTASHCVVCDVHHMPLEWADIYFGYRSSRNYLYKYDGWYYYWYGTDFTESGGYSMDWDYAYFRFDERVGDRVGWLGWQVLSDEQIQSKRLTVAGYRDGELKYDRDYAEVRSPHIISFQADTVPGNSGGPIFFYDDIGDPYAVGIGIAENWLAQENYGYRLTSWMAQYMSECGLFN